MKMDVSPRYDNGLINTSPISNMPPVVRVYRDCSGTIKIPGWPASLLDPCSYASWHHMHNTDIIKKQLSPNLKNIQVANLL